MPLFLAYGSIASLVKALNEVHGQAEGSGTIHANRVHALFSADTSRALNSASLAAIRSAAEALYSQAALTDLISEGGARLRQEARRLHLFSGATSSEVASRLAVPQAVANSLLTDHRSLVATESNLRRDPLPSNAPDWGYQNIAVARCLEALSNGVTPRVGLVLPTGAGKTRTALRIILAKLRETPTSQAPALWVTHRKNLREQAHRELQKLIAAGELSPTDLTLAARIKFVMVRSLEEHLTLQPVLIVIDEAHHAAADSYQPAFANLPPTPILLLTATPNRTDGLPIGIDEIAFTITYRELAERGAVLIPDFLDFPVENFDWSGETIDQLAQFVVERCQSTFTKVLVLAPRIDRVEEFFEAILRVLPEDQSLEPDDLGYIHGSGNSLGIDNEDFLARFAAKPKAVLVSAQLLLEGFDDPAIDTVIITYPSSSMVRLMQAAGRCVRYAPGKTRAFVVQARNDKIAYHFDHRWLYQEISDYLRPEVVDIDYASSEERLAGALELMRAHNVSPQTAALVADRISNLKPGEPSRLFVYGLPHYGNVADFGTEAKWGVVLEAGSGESSIRTIFNEFCAQGADASDPSFFLERAGAEFGIAKDGAANSTWRSLMGLLTAAYCAKCEVHGPQAAILDNRPYSRSRATTWLKYINFVYRPTVPSALMSFLADCHNRESICVEYSARTAEYEAAVKVPLPLAGSEAFLLDTRMAAELDALIAALRERLSGALPQDQFSVLAGFLASVPNQISPRLLHRIEFLTSADAQAERFLRLTNVTEGEHT